MFAENARPDIAMGGGFFEEGTVGGTGDKRLQSSAWELVVGAPM